MSNIIAAAKRYDKETRLNRTNHIHPNSFYIERRSMKTFTIFKAKADKILKVYFSDHRIIPKNI